MERIDDNNDAVEGSRVRIDEVEGAIVVILDEGGGGAA